MTIQHRDLAAGRWRSLSFVEQLANVGSEVERALNWRQKQNTDYSLLALDRALPGRPRLRTGSQNSLVLSKFRPAIPAAH
jgi:hypothetical protein